MKPYTGIINAMVTDSGLNGTCRAAAYQAMFDSAKRRDVRPIMTVLPCGTVFATFHMPSNYGPH